MEDTTVLDNQATDTSTTQSQDQGSAGTQTGAVTQPDEKYKLWDGEHSRKDVETWRESHNNMSKWQKELTQKSQEISAWEQAVNWLQDPAVSMRDKRKWFEQYLPEVKEEAREQLEETGEVNPEMKQVLSELNSLKSELAGYRTSTQQREIQGQLDTAREQFKDRWNEKAERHIKNMWVAEGGNLVEVAKNYFADLDELLSSGKKQYIEGKKKDLSNLTMQPKGGAAPSSPSKPLTEEDRRKSMAKDLFGEEE